jgi:hypothetical protein
MSFQWGGIHTEGTRALRLVALLTDSMDIVTYMKQGIGRHADSLGMMLSLWL